MTGWRTLILSALALVSGVAAKLGIVIPASDQAAIAAFVLTAVLVIQRINTSAPVSWSSSTVAYMVVAAAAAVLQAVGVVLPQSEQAALMTGAIALAGLIARVFTRTPVGEERQEWRQNE